MKNIILSLLIFTAVLPMSGCNYVQDAFSSWFGNKEKPVEIPVDFQDLIDAWDELGLPDLGDIADLPGLDSLPLLSDMPGGIVYRGPLQRKLTAGNRIPGTDIVLLRTTDDGAEFEIAGLRSVRVSGDSLDFDGEWPSMPGTTYNSRLRIYKLGDGSVRVAGVHQLGIPDISPLETGVHVKGESMKFPFIAHVSAGDTISGTTYGYVGMHDRGAELFGIAAGDYPYRKPGDSIQWRGDLRPDVPVEYNVRTIHYDDNALQVGGVVSVSLP